MDDLFSRDAPKRARIADPERKWWPAEYADEVMPPPRDSASAWLVRDCDGWFLAGCGDGNDESPALGRKLVEGEAVEFLWSEDRGDVEITVYPGGRYEAHGAVPADATHFWAAFDSDTLAMSLDEFAKNWADMEGHAPGVLPERVDVAMHAWSDEIPYRLVIENGEAKFEPIAGEVPFQ
jgi:hypothetical protein